jgi:hypothetical protein
MTDAAVLLTRSNDVTSVIVIVAVMAAVISTIFYFRRAAAKARTAAIRALAHSHGWRFVAEKDGELPRAHLHLKTFDVGHSKSARNVVRFAMAGLTMEMFDYHYTTGSGKHAQHHSLSVCIAEVPHPFLYPLVVRPEHFGDKLAAAVGFNDIDFESDEFSREFHVSSPDRKFAFALSDQRMMEWFLARRGTRVELWEAKLLVRVSEELLRPDELARLPALAEGLWVQVPQHVKDQMKQS